MTVQEQSVATQAPRTLDRPGLSLLHYWRPGLLVAALVALFGPTLLVLVRQWWEDPNYSHGLVLPLLCGYIIWRRRDELKTMPPKPSAWGGVVVGISLFFLLLGSLGAELFLARIGFWGTCVGLVLYFSGFAVLRKLIFPIGLFLLAIPIPALVFNEIVFPMQLVASKFATVCLEAINLMPVLREGNLLVLPGYTLEVVEACSGIRSLMSLIALAVAYGYFVEERTWVRWLLVAIVFPLAIFSNGVRVFVTALLTHYWGLAAAEGFLHSFSGWAIFVVSMVLLFAFHALLTFVIKRTVRKHV